MKKTISAFLVLLLSAFLLSGCAKRVDKSWLPIGGSKADATVKVGYQWNPITEIPVVHSNQAQEIATKKCQAWGYTSAEPFGTIFENCSRFENGFGGIQCTQMTGVMEYQCIGGTTYTPTDANTSQDTQAKKKK